MVVSTVNMINMTVFQLGSMMVTYLVVLLQLDLSKPQILRDAVNVTSPTTTDDVSA